MQERLAALLEERKKIVEGMSTVQPKIKTLGAEVYCHLATEVLTGLEGVRSMPMPALVVGNIISTFLRGLRKGLTSTHSLCLTSALGIFS